MLGDLFLLFFKIGLFTFGGGYAMIPLISGKSKNRAGSSIRVYGYLTSPSGRQDPIAINCDLYRFQAEGFYRLAARDSGVCPAFLHRHLS